jgi:uroporphyrinogen III methyltransferase/synthase
MGMRRIHEICQAVMDGGREPSTPAAVVQWGARPEQQTVVGRLVDIADVAGQAGLESPAIIIIGEVVSLREKLRWYDNQPLFGKRILIPRPMEQARSTAALVRGRGAIPVVHPAIEISPIFDPSRLRRAVVEAKTYDWVIFTSQNGVKAFFGQVQAAGKDARVFGCARVAVIGPKTAQALQSYGIVADLCAEEFVAESLVEGLRQAGNLGRVLIPRARLARDVLPDALRSSGAEVDVVVAYETQAVSGEARAALCDAIERHVDVILFTSSSMVEATAEALGDEAKSILSKRLIACIGPVTAGTARRLGLNVGVEASVYTVDGVLDALEAHFTRESS